MIIIIWKEFAYYSSLHKIASVPTRIIQDLLSEKLEIRNLLSNQFCIPSRFTLRVTQGEAIN